MSDPFGSPEMAVGYANARPPAHQRIVDAALAGTRFRRALDVGCGAGISTRALAAYSDERIGLDPWPSMVAAAGAVDRGASGFFAARAEQLPVRASSCDLLSAAGSLNYCDPVAAFREARRALTPDGVMLAYDFAPVKAGWFAGFIDRFPAPVGEALPLWPERLAELAQGFRMEASQQVAFEISLERAFYVRYMMTESNVAFAVRSGALPKEVRSWIESTLPDETKVVAKFAGYFARFRREE